MKRLPQSEVVIPPNPRREHMQRMREAKQAKSAHKKG